uniref:Uncharacterized protein n=1 Tax=Eutreptiella gymnastica TaxID=73025 RepID=A0A6T2BIB3_9EUGL
MGCINYNHLSVGCDGLVADLRRLVPVAALNVLGVQHQHQQHLHKHLHDLLGCNRKGLYNGIFFCLGALRTAICFAAQERHAFSPSSLTSTVKGQEHVLGQ